MIVVPATKNATSKNHPILSNKNHLNRIVLVHLTLNDAFKTRKHLRMVGYWILNIVNTWNFVQLPHCLTTFPSLDAKWNIIQLQFYAATTNWDGLVPLWDVSFGVLTGVGPLHLIVPLSSIRLFFFMQWSHIDVLISLSSASSHHNISFKVLVLH